ncbi:MAG: class I SAM-dependent methyltransferase [Chloroflexota bacterium]
MPEPIIASKGMIEQIFDGAATSYDRVGPSIFAQFGTRLIEHVPLGPDTHVLDVATGNGAVLLPAALRVGSKGHVIGIDLSSAILKEAKHLVQAYKLVNVELLKMDAEHLEFTNHTFDVVTCGFGLFFFPDIEAALSEMYRVCKPSGYICVSVFNKTPRPFDPGWPILLQQFTEYQVGIRMPQKVAYALDEVEAMLSRFAFRPIDIHSETSDIVYACMEDWWAFQLTLGSRATILGMNRDMRERFKEEYLAKLHPLLRQDGIHLPIAVVYALAQR